jgi:pilus assembly protein CpaE
MVLAVDGQWRKTLAFSSRVRVPFVVTGPNELEAVRIALKAGARDYLTKPIAVEELYSSLVEVVQSAGGSEPGEVISVISPKGGSGGTVIAVNLARSLIEKGRVAVVNWT